MSRKQNRRESYISLSGGELIDVGRRQSALSLSTSKLDTLYNGGEWISPILESDRFKDILFPNSRTTTPIVGPLFEEAEEEQMAARGVGTVMTSLPPPPRRAGKKRSFKKPTPLRKSSASRLRSGSAAANSAEGAAPAVSRSSSRKESAKPPLPPGIVAEGVNKPAKKEASSQLQEFGSPIIRRKRTFTKESSASPIPQPYTFLKDDDHVALTPTVSTPPLLDPIQISTPLSEHFSLIEDDDDSSDGSKYSQSQVSTPVLPLSATRPPSPKDEQTVETVVVDSPKPVTPDSGRPVSILVTGQHKRYSLSTVPKMGPVPPRKSTTKAELVNVDKTAGASTHADATRLLKGPSKPSSTATRERLRQRQKHRGATMPYGVAVSAKLLQPTRQRSNVLGGAGEHAGSHTKSSRSSWESESAASSVYPPSTIDAASALRISISSTIYPDSARTLSTNHHHHHIHNLDDNSSSGASFIQIGSPIPESDDANHNLYYHYQPNTPTSNDLLKDIQDEQTIDPDNYQLMSILSGSRLSAMQHKRHESASPLSGKPPLPTTPKPRFTRRALSPQSQSTPSSPQMQHQQLVFEGYDEDPVPPTTNWLNQEERADLVRKSRKLARVFGRTPGPDVMAYQNTNSISSSVPLSSHGNQQRHHRTPLSLSNNDLLLEGSSGVRQRRRMSAWPSPTESQFAGSTNSSGNSRRHSAPLSPDDISFLTANSPLYEAGLTQVASRFRSDSLIQDPHKKEKDTQEPSKHQQKQPSSSPHTSFIDLSDDETPHDDGTSSIFEGRNGGISNTKKKTALGKRPVSMSAQSLIENMTPEEQAEEERRRKRERLAKLHRHLGSRVPASLVLGVDHENASLPPPFSGEISGGSPDANDESAAAKRKAWLRLRRRSSSAALPPTWVSDLERSKEELDTKEKALNVRRAQKMEKVFGVAPPQTLYHTRQPTLSTPALVQQTTTPKISTPSAFMLPETSYFARNPNQSSFNKRKSKHRPGTSESSKALLSKDSTSPTSIRTVTDTWGKDAKLVDDTVLDIRRHSKGSAIYNHYQHSMNSLNDILDRDDRESLVELHNYLNGDLDLDEDNDNLLVGPFDNTPSKPNVSPSDTIMARRPSNASSLRTERRRSLPTRTSLGSLASEYSISSLLNSPAPEPSTNEFQVRRKRAAKLTQFFGVHYRELIKEVLMSLESGMERDRDRGTLQAEEFDDLLQRLRELKTKREGIF